jgi:signal transduction histidine kinase
VASWRPALGSVRARTTLVAVLVVAVAAAPGAYGLVEALRSSLEASIESSERSELAQLAALVRSGAPLDQQGLPVEDHMAQVVDASGSVRAASVELRGMPALAPGPPSRDHPGIAVARLRSLPSGLEGPWLLLSTLAVGPQGPWTVHVIGSLRPVETSTRTATVGLELGLPTLILLLGATVWILAGRMLRPVEAVRTGAVDSARRDLARRLPEPAGDDEVARLARTMNEMLERLEASAARERRFVADASHELRSPLAAIQAQVDVALTRPERADWVATAKEISLETQRMQRIVEDLLLLAKVDEGVLAPRLGAVDLDELVLAEARRLRDRGLVEVDLSRVSGARVSGDRDQLTQVVRNLLVNAERHAARLVRLELGLTRGEAVLVVADDGPGIPEADRERVFERFTRLDEARSRGRGGAGLGLAIARQIVQAHGGTITIADQGPGARFVVRVPATRGA